MFKQLVLILPVIIMVFLLPITAYEQAGVPHIEVWPVADYERLDPELLREVGVSREKSESLGKLDLEFRTEIGNLIDQIRVSREELKILILKEEPDLVEIEDVLKDQESIRTKIILMGIKHELYIKKTLTHEEWKKFMRLRIERTRRWQKRSYGGM